MPAFSGMTKVGKTWMPAFAGMTNRSINLIQLPPPRVPGNDEEKTDNG